MFLLPPRPETFYKNLMGFPGEFRFIGSSIFLVNYILLLIIRYRSRMPMRSKYKWRSLIGWLKLHKVLSADSGV